MQVKTVEETLELEHGSYTYRIFSDKVKGTYLIKRIRKGDTDWSHSVKTDMWDGERFTHTFRATPMKLNSFIEVMEVIVAQEKVDA